MASFELKRTEHGFSWGPVIVTCEAQHDAAGVMLSLETERERVYIRVTPKGFIRLGTVNVSTKRGVLPGSTTQEDDMAHD